MKQQDKSAGQRRFSASAVRDLRAAYLALDRAVCRRHWLVLGSVNVVAAKSPSASTTYTWTRKVRAKTVTVSLSRQQFAAFRQAIAANRQIEAALRRLRQATQSALLTDLPGVRRRRLDVPQNTDAKNVPKGA